MKPTKLKRHLETNHPELVNKDEVFFKRHANAFEKQKIVFEKSATVPQKALRASLEASYLIGKSMKPHTIGESLLLPAAIKIVSVFHGTKYGNDLKCIPLSRDTVSRRITALSENIKSQLLERLKVSPNFAMQLDESTDVANLAQLLVYVRYCYFGDILEDFLFCQPLKGRTTGADIFDLVNMFFRSNGVLWSNCIAICTDGAAALTGSKTGFKAKVIEIAPHVTFQHCLIHREALASKKLEPEVNEVLQEAVKVVNLIKAKALNHRLFAILCNEMGSDHDTLLLHTEVRWLSRGKVLRRLLDLKDEVRIFLLERNSSLSQHFMDEKWLSILSYLVDIFDKLNDLNVSLQGQRTNILILSDKLKAFIRKIDLWNNEVAIGNFDAFLCLAEFINENNLDCKDIQMTVTTHLTNLKQNFSDRFEEFPENELGWIRDPFSFSSDSKGTLKEKEELIEISSDETLRKKFKTTTWEKFWLSVKNEYPELSRKALLSLLPFSSTYLCESAFSSLTAIKTKHRSRLDLEADLRVAVSNIVPDMEAIIPNIQAQISH